MPMFYLDKRIQVICDELKKLSVRKSTPVENIFYKKGLFFRPDEAGAAEAPFEPFDSRTMHWYGPDEHYWFYFDCDLAPATPGMVRRLLVSTQYVQEWDARNPQFLAFVNGEPVQGLDTNHREIRLDLTGPCRIDLQAYTGIDQQERGVILGNQRKTGQTQMALCLKELEEHLAQLVQSIIFHVGNTSFYLTFIVYFFLRRIDMGGASQGRRRLTSISG